MCKCDGKTPYLWWCQPFSRAFSFVSNTCEGKCVFDWHDDSLFSWDPVHMQIRPKSGRSLRDLWPETLKLSGQQLQALRETNEARWRGEGEIARDGWEKEMESDCYCTSNSIYSFRTTSYSLKVASDHKPTSLIKSQCIIINMQTLQTLLYNNL